MTRRHWFIAALAALPGLLAAVAAHALFETTIAPSGKVVSETRNPQGFSGIAVAVPGTVVVRQGEPAAVAIEADDNLLSEIETVVERAVLRVRFKRNLAVAGHATIRLLVTSPAIESLAVAGGGDIVAESIRSPSLALSVAGSGDVRIARLEAQSLKASIAGSGDIAVAGRATEVSVKIAGSGDVKAGRLEGQRAQVSISGSGNASVWARDSLHASIAGSGNVRYYGDPAVTKKIAGAGSIQRLGREP